MSDNQRPQRNGEGVISAEALKKAEQYIEAEEGAANKLRGALGTSVTALAVIMSLFHLYAAYAIMPTHVLRGIHVAFILVLCFLLYPVAKRLRHRVRWWDWLAAAISLVIVGNMLFGGDAFLERAIDPNTWDQILGVALIVLVLEAARRTTGWIMPLICILFLIYAVVGQHLPAPCLDEEAAKRSHFGGLVASGWHTASVFMKLQSKMINETGTDVRKSGPSPGYRNLRWLKPVFAGDTLTYSTEVVRKRELATRPDWGIVFTHITAVDQRGEPVYEFEGSVLFARRDAAL